MDESSEVGRFAPAAVLQRKQAFALQSGFAARRIGVVLMLVAMAVSMSGCRLLRGGRTVQKPPDPAFESPIAATGRPGMAPEEIAQIIAARQGKLHSVQASLSISVGQASAKARQQFDGFLYAKFAGGRSDRKKNSAGTAPSPEPQIVRIKGSGEAGPIFDYLQTGRTVKLVLYPDRRAYEGDVDGLARNPDLLAGIQPGDLLDSFLVERRLARAVDAGEVLQEAGDGYVVVDTNGGMAANPAVFHLRTDDLLADAVDVQNASAPRPGFSVGRMFGRGRSASTTLSRVRYFGYQAPAGAKGALVPTRFDAQLGPAELSVTASDVELNSAAPATVQTLDIPPGFQRMDL